jgi:sarcosine oxidase subunit gamma
MADRVSPLAGLTAPRAEGLCAEPPGVTLSTRADLRLWQVAAWRPADCAAALSAAVGAPAPAPGRTATGPGGTLARTGPLKWWLLDGPRPAIDPAIGALLDLSCEQTPIRIEGPDAGALLARVVAVDLRETAFPTGAFAATGGHHMMLKLHRTGPCAYEIFVMRSYARTLWGLLLDHARQFGVAVV